MTVAHFTLEFGTRHQSGDRIDDQNIDRARADERIGDLERLLAGVRLRDQQVVDIDAELAGIHRVERVLGVNKSAGTAAPLRFGDDVQRERRLPGALRAVNLDDTAARQPADAERDVEAQGARRNYLGVGGGLTRSELHNRALAKSSFDLPERRVQSPLLVHRFLVQQAQCRLHEMPPYSIASEAVQCGRKMFLYALCS